MNLSEIEPSVRIGRNVKVIAEEVELGRNVRLGDNVSIQARRLRLADHVHIGQEVVVEADTLEIGHSTRIEARCRLSGSGGPARLIQIGEQTLLAHDTKLLVPVAVIGDYTDIHNHCLLYGRKSLLIGHNVWIGQNNILNAEECLTIGNNVGAGSYTSIFTHGYFGELLEGCQVFKVAPVVIEDDVWILGAYNTISPGVTLGSKSLVLNGSVVTKDVPSNHTVGGSPARDLTDRLTPYRDISPCHKFDRIQTFVQEFLDAKYPGDYQSLENGFRVSGGREPFCVAFVPELVDVGSLPADRPLLVFAQTSTLTGSPKGVTVFDLTRKHYLRTRSEPEVQLLRFLKSYRARFVPADNPRVSIPQRLWADSWSGQAPAVGSAAAGDQAWPAHSCDC